MRLYGYDSMPGAPGNNLASTSFAIPGGAAVGKPLLPNMPELKQKGRRDPSFPPEENIPFVVPGAMLPGVGIMPTIGNVGGMAQLPPGYVKSVY